MPFNAALFANVYNANFGNVDVQLVKNKEMQVKLGHRQWLQEQLQF